MFSLSECLTLFSYLKVGVVELVGDVPSKHKELPPLQQDGVEETDTEEQLPVLLRSLTAQELLVCHQVVQTLHVTFQTL